MKLDKNELCKALKLYAVTDRHWLNPLCDPSDKLSQKVEQAILGGATFVQLREKNLCGTELENLARKIQIVCKKYNVPFVINDNVELAKKIDADGVHVGQSDMNATDVRKIIGDNKILGVSAQTVEQAILAQINGADYLGVGAVFVTDTKDDADFVSKKTLCDICKSVNIPVVAIGGICKDNICQLQDTGIVGVSVISAIFAQPDVKEATKVLKHCVIEIF